METTPTRRVCRAPTSQRENMSRPRWSRPNQFSPRMPTNLPWLGKTSARQFWAVGPCGASIGPTMATSTNAAMMAAPMMAILLERIRRNASRHRLLPETDSELWVSSARRSILSALLVRIVTSVQPALSGR